MNDPEADRATTQPAEPGRRAAGHKGPAARHLTQLWGVSFGDAALASFVLCAVSGVLLLPAFDARDGARSIALWLLANPGATVLRNLHYWTAQACLVLVTLHAWDHLRRGREGRLARGVWLRLVPEEDRERPAPRSFTSSYRALVRDVGRPLLLLALLSIVALVAWAFVDLISARNGYLRVAIFHGPLELVAAAFFFIEKQTPASASAAGLAASTRAATA